MASFNATLPSVDALLGPILSQGVSDPLRTIDFYTTASIDATPPTVTYNPPSGTSFEAPGGIVTIQAADETEILRCIVSVELAPAPGTGKKLWEVVYNGARFSDRYAGSVLVTNTPTLIAMQVIRNGGFAAGENPRFEVILFDKAGNIATS